MAWQNKYLVQHLPSIGYQVNIEARNNRILVTSLLNNTNTRIEYAGKYVDTSNETVLGQAIPSVAWQQACLPASSGAWA